MMAKTLMTDVPQISTGTIVSADGRELLLQLVEAIGADLDTVTTRQLEDLADQLTEVAGSGKSEGRSWSRSYLHQVLRGKIQPSAKLTAACAGLLNEMAGTPALLTRSRPVMVMATGQVEPGAVVFGDSRKCKRVGCQVHFVPKCWNHNYCTKECREQAKP
jgi:hypothetical protein